MRRVLGEQVVVGTCSCPRPLIGATIGKIELPTGLQYERKAELLESSVAFEMATHDNINK